MSAPSLAARTLASFCLALALAACTSEAGSPSVAVSQGATAIASGGTAAANDAVVGAPASTTFKLSNTGNAALVVNGVTVGGADADSFSVTSNPAASVAAGGSTTFALTFNPPSAGAGKTATVTIASNAPAFTFTVKANATAAPVSNIAVSANAAPVTSGGAPVEFGSALTTASKSVTFTITNSGTAALAITAATVTNGASDFALTTQPGPTAAAGGGTATFVVKFAPSAGGARTGAITLANSSANQPSFVVALSGAGIQAATGVTITGAGGATSITGPGNTLQLSAVVAPASAGQAVTWTSANAAVATVSSSGLVTAVSAGLTLVTATATDGTGIAGSFNLTVLPAPVSNIAVSVNAAAVTSGGAAIDLGSALTSASRSATFTITNSGAAALAITSASVTSGASDFSITAAPTSTVAAAGGTATFTVKFAPAAGGARTGAVTVANSSANQPSFVINLSGTGVQAVTSVVVTGAGGASSITGPGNTLQLSAAVAPASAGQGVTWSSGTPAVATVSASGLVTAVSAGTTLITASATDGTGVSGTLSLTVLPAPVSNIAVSANSAAVTSGGAAVAFGSALTTANKSTTFTVTNSGTAALAITSATVTAGASDFSITTAPAASVAASGGSTTFVVKFAPSAGGARTGAVTLVNSSANQASFVVNLGGTGVQAATGVTVTGAGGATSITGPGNTLQLSAAVAPANAGQGVTWSSGATSVATVNASGLVTAVATGTSVITATTTDGTGVSGTLSLTVLPTPVSNIAVTAGGSAVTSSGAPVDFGTVLTSAYGTVTFTIANSGTAALALTSATVTSGASDFSIISAPSSTVAAGGSTTFVAEFTPTASGQRAGAITLANSSANQPSFVIVLGGTGVQAATSVTVSGAGGATSITGPGNTLQLSAAVLPANAGQSVTWTSGTPAVATIDASGLVTAVSVGATLITATAADGSGAKGTFGLDVLAAPVANIVVSANASAVTSGGVATDFGSALTGASKSTTFTITNSGNADLAITSATVTSGASDFSITAAPASTVTASGGTTSFVVKFAPSAGGVLTGAVTLANSSANQASFVVNLSGTGVPAASSIAVTGVNGIVTISGLSTLQVGAVVSPAGAGQSVTWSSGTPAVATVSAAGLVTAVAQGSTLITATATDGTGVTGSLTVTVTAPGSVSFVKQTNGTTAATLSAGVISASSTYGTSGNAFKYVAPNYYGTNANGFVTLPTTLTGDFYMTATVTMVSAPKSNTACGIGLGITTGFAATDRYAYMVLPTSGSSAARYVSGPGAVGAGAPAVAFSLNTPVQLTFNRVGSNLTYGIGTTLNTAGVQYFTDGTTVYGAGTVYPTISFNNVVATVTKWVISDGTGTVLYDSATGSLGTLVPASINLSSSTATMLKGAQASVTATALALGGAVSPVTAVAADPSVVGVTVTNNASNSTVTLSGLKGGYTTVTVTNTADANAATNSKVIAVSVNDFSTADGYGSITGKVYPAPGEAAAYVDGELAITFDNVPTLNTGGSIGIYKAADGSLADSISYAGETQTVAGVSMAVGAQLARVSGNTVYFTPHFGKLAYGTAYYVGIPTTAITGLLNNTTFAGFSNLSTVATWSFTTRAAPTLGTTVTVDGSQSGAADFRTVGGALMYLAANPVAGATAVAVNVAAGTYLELVNYRAVTPNPALTITISGPAGNNRGDNAVIQYTNGGNLNAQNGRASFYFAGANLVLQNLTLKNTGVRAVVSQAETLYFNSGAGYTLATNNCSFLSFQDTIQTSGRAWFYNSYIEGNTDFIWGTSDAALFEHSALRVINELANNATSSNVFSMFVARTGTTGASTIGKGYVLLNSTVSIDTGVVASYGRDAGTGAFYDQVALVGNTFSGGGALTAGLWVTTTAPLSLGDSTYVGWKASGNTGLGVDTAATATGTASTINSVGTEYATRDQILNRVVTVAGGVPTGFTAAASLWDTSSLASAWGAP